MTKKQKEILADAILEIATREDKCGDSKCDKMHAIIGVLSNKGLLDEAIELAKKEGFNNA